MMTTARQEENRNKDTQPSSTKTYDEEGTFGPAARHIYGRVLLTCAAISMRSSLLGSALTMPAMWRWPADMARSEAVFPALSRFNRPAPWLRSRNTQPSLPNRAACICCPKRFNQHCSSSFSESSLGRGAAYSKIF